MAVLGPFTGIALTFGVVFVGLLCCGAALGAISLVASALFRVYRLIFWRD